MMKPKPGTNMPGLRLCEVSARLAPLFAPFFPLRNSAKHGIMYLCEAAHTVVLKKRSQNMRMEVSFENSDSRHGHLGNRARANACK